MLTAVILKMCAIFLLTFRHFHTFAYLVALLFTMSQVLFVKSQNLYGFYSIYITIVRQKWFDESIYLLKIPHAIFDIPVFRTFVVFFRDKLLRVE